MTSVPLAPFSNYCWGGTWGTALGPHFCFSLQVFPPVPSFPTPRVCVTTCLLLELGIVHPGLRVLLHSELPHIWEEADRCEI